MKRLLVASLLAVASTSFGVVVFEDGFESGDFTKWPIDANPGFTIRTDQVHSGTFSAGADTAARRRAASIAPIATDLITTFSFWMYDTAGPGGDGRQFSEIRSYSGDAYGTGGLEQIHAIGIYNNVTMEGETHSSSKYQARILSATSAGWFTLTDAPNRSVGWHEFKVVLSGNTASYYVDGALGRTITGANAFTIDSVVMGSGLSSGTQSAFYDDFTVEANPVPEPATLAALGVGAAALVRRRAKK